MYNKRHIDTYLNEWRFAKSKKPLLLRGARQIGKSTTIRHLGTYFDHFVEINFEDTPEVRNFFQGNFDVQKIIENLAIYYGTEIIPGKTLLFFDEIQNCPEAINSLRYFFEKIPTLHVIATGSLLEFALTEISTFGVGRIISVFMYPMSFDEFLNAIGEEKLLLAKQKATLNNPLNDALHNKLNDYLFTFILIGGMPEAVAEYVQEKSLLAVQNILTNLQLSFNLDFAKYKKRVPAQRISSVFNAVIQQSGGKFVLANVKDTNSKQVKEALQLLILSGLIIPTVHSSANGIPLGAEANEKKIKYYLMDTGLFQNILGINLSELVVDIKNIINKGILAEQFWSLEYIKYQSVLLPPKLFYWHREVPNANAEVDYVVQKGNYIFPVEIKSSGKGSMQSMHQFMLEKKSKNGYRFSLENFSEYEKIKVIPLYAVSSCELI